MHNANMKIRGKNPERIVLSVSSSIDAVFGAGEVTFGSSGDVVELFIVTCDSGRDDSAAGTADGWVTFEEEEEEAVEDDEKKNSSSNVDEVGSSSMLVLMLVLVLVPLFSSCCCWFGCCDC